MERVMERGLLEVEGGGVGLEAMKILKPRQP